jgi:hypothetical protein
MYALGWDEEGEAWKWRRRLWVWEEELVEECRTLLLIVSLQENINDVWTWIQTLRQVIQLEGCTVLLLMVRLVVTKCV